jgi:hypothetical protein
VESRLENQRMLREQEKQQESPGQGGSEGCHLCRNDGSADRRNSFRNSTLEAPP